MTEPKDLIERLRAGICGDRCRFMEARLGCECDEAAESIHSLATENAALREKLAERDALLQWFHARRFALQSKFDLHGPADFAEAMRNTFKQIDALTGGDNA